MKRYAVAFMSFFDNDLQIKFVDAFSKLDAIKNLYPDYFNEGLTLEQVKSRFFDADAVIEIKEII